jgi:hypothetical protein
VSSSLLDAIVRDGARQMLAAALAAEVAAYIEAHSGEVDVNGHRLVVRNGYHAEREVTTAAGAVTVRAPRVNDKRIDEATGQRCRFSSAILPAWARKSPQTAEVLPLLYLHGLSTSDFAPALEQFLGTSHGLSAATVTRLTEQWKDDARAFAARSLAEVDYVYVWVDGIHLKVRLEQDKVCLLVMIGVRADGTKELVALSDGFRESSESWADLLRDCKRRGMTAPVLAVGDGALGFWKAIRDVFPDTKEQRCWWHKIGNCSPRSRVGVPGRERLWPRSTTPRVISKQPDQGGHETGRHVGQRELPGQVRLLDGWGAWLDSDGWGAWLESDMQGGPVDELLDVAVERPVLDQLQVEVGRPLKDRVHSGLTGDDREKRQLQVVDEAGGHQRPVQREAAVRA